MYSGIEPTCFTDPGGHFLDLLFNFTKLINMSVFLPMFPLRMVVFPGEPVNLHIFEPRYRQLIHECEAQGTTFGIPPFLDNKVMPIGTELELLAIAKTYSDGKMDIRTRGVGRFRIEEFFAKAPNRLYGGAEIERLPEPENVPFEPILVQKIAIGVTKLYEVLRIKRDPPPSDAPLRSFELAHHVGFSQEQEYEFLEIDDEIARQEFLVNHLDRLLPVVEEMENLRKRVQMNGHFKNVIPPDIS